MKKIVLACLATLALTHPASAAAGTCLDAADPAGDGAFLGAAADPGDLVRVSAVADDASLTATFHVNGTLPVESPYAYVLAFSDGTNDYTLNAHVLGTQADRLYQLRVRASVQDGGSASVSAWYRYDVSGSIDPVTGTVTITAPAALFGTSSLAGHVWHATRAETMAGAAQTNAGPFDYADLGGATFTGGDGTCA